MSDALDDAARRARRTYEAAADTYDHPALGFWSRVGTRTVERLALRPGDDVLDVPAGSGASALPVARAVQPDGRVIAADISPALLVLARAKAAAQGLDNLETRVGDMRALGFPDGHFDAVVSVFGVFFVPDRVGLVRELWRLVKPGGRLAVTTWGPEVLEPGSSAFWDAVGRERPDLARGFDPWDDLVRPEQLTELFAAAGIDGATAELEEGEQALRGPDDWWAIVLGSGFRGTVEELEPAQRERVCRAVLDAMRGVTAVRASAIYGAAVKPPG